MNPSDQVYEVQILYREPLYELWTGSQERPPFVARYRGIQALDQIDAARIARGRFDELAGESQVKWHREVVEIRVEPIV